MLIDKSYFYGDVLIAQKTGDEGNINRFIQECEPEILQALLGYSLYKAFLAALLLEVGPVPGPAVLLEQRFIDLRNGKEYTGLDGQLTKWKGLIFTDNTAKRSLIANYVYFKYTANEATITTGTGEKIGDAANSSAGSPRKKMANAWNKMQQMNMELRNYLLSYPLIYPEFVDYNGMQPRQFYKRINAYGI